MTGLSDDLAPQPLATATALHPRFYAGEAAAARDRDAVFARHWQYLCHVSQLADDGEPLSLTLGTLPVLVLRTPDGLRGLHAVCRHRAGPLDACRGGGRRFLRCRYHAWSYDLDGRLLDAPEMRGAEGFDPAAVRLPALELREFAGLVFGRIGPGPADFKAVVAGMAARLARAGHDLAALRWHHRTVYDIDCNWKVYVDNYLEGYHIPTIHPTLDGILDYRSYTTEVARWHSLQSSPLDSAPDAYGTGEALYYFIHPNTLLNILPGRLQTNRVLPLPGDRCRVEFDFFYAPTGEAPGDEAAAAERRRHDAAFSDLVQREDIDICVAVQRNLGSGAYTPGRLNPLRESGVHHFHELLRADYRSVAGG